MEGDRPEPEGVSEEDSEGVSEEVSEGDSEGDLKLEPYVSN